MLAGMLWRVWPVAEGEQELDGPAGELDGGEHAEGEEVINNKWSSLHNSSKHLSNIMTYGCLLFTALA